MNENIKTPDAIIVGGGIAGLYTACNLLKENVSILVLEGRERVAGRQYTQRDDWFGYADMGGAYVGPQQTKILKVLEELDIKTYSKVSTLKSALRLKDLKMRYMPPFPLLKNPVVMLDLNNIMRLIDNLSLEIPIEEPWEHPKAHEWDNMTVQDFFDRNIWTKETMALAKVSVCVPFLVEPANMSFLYFLHEIRMCGGLVAITTVEGGLQERKLMGGSDQLSLKLHEQVKENVIFNETVMKVEQMDDFVKVTTHNSIYKAKRVVMCIPLPALYNVTFIPPLEKHMNDIIEVEPLGHSIKAFSFYEKRFWQDQGLSGEIISEDGATTWAFDDTKLDGSNPAIMALITGEKAERLGKMSQEERCRALAETYHDATGLSDFLSPVHYVDKHWQDDDARKFGRNCCVWSLPPGVITKNNKFPDARYHNVYFASSEFALTSRGYMDGALRSSDRATQLVLQSLGKEYRGYDSMEFSESIPYVPRRFIEKCLPSVPVALTILIILLLVIIAILLVAIFV